MRLAGVFAGGKPHPEGAEAARNEVGAPYFEEELRYVRTASTRR